MSSVDHPPSLRVSVVGPCGSGKSTLVRALRERGYTVRHVAQEHSYVPDMWLRLTRPDALIYLHAAYATTVARRQLNWTPDEYAEQLRRLAHARQHAGLIVPTDDLTPGQVLGRALDFLAARASSPATPAP